MTDFQTYRPSLDEILNGTPLTPAEEELLAACKTDGIVSFGDEVPEEATPENSIRGALIRFLMMGGQKKHRPSAQGITVCGAMIAGDFELDGCNSPISLNFFDCNFEMVPIFRGCEVGGLALSGSLLPGLDAQGVCVRQNVSLNDGFYSTGIVDLCGAQVRGQLNCNGGRFGSSQDAVLIAQNVTIGSDVLLSNGFHASGAVDFTSATIQGQFNCKSGTIVSSGDYALKASGITVGGCVFLSHEFHAGGLVDLTGAVIGEQLACCLGRFKSGLRLPHSRIGANFIWAYVLECGGELDLSYAKTSVLWDDPRSWEVLKKVNLEGFAYERLDNDLSVEERLNWVEQASSDADPIYFSPQPHTQLAQYYQSIGQRQAAARVLYEREKHLARAEWARAHKKLDGTWREAFRCQGADFVQMFRRIFQAFAGFGHKPMRAFYWALGTVAFSMLYFHLTYINGQMVPNSDIILNSQAWIGSVDINPDFPVQAWETTAPGSDYETFSAIGYGFDLFVPLDALGQEIAWAPSYSRGGWGAFGHYLRWPIQIMGWVLTAIGAALLTGLIGRDRD